jgi:hypothetical protein
LIDPPAEHREWWIAIIRYPNGGSAQLPVFADGVANGEYNLFIIQRTKIRSTVP